MKPLMMQYYDMNNTDVAGSRVVHNDTTTPTPTDDQPTKCTYTFNVAGPGFGAEKNKLFSFTKGTNNCVWTVSGMTDAPAK